MTSQLFLLVGEVCVDVLATRRVDHKITRLGGIAHAARALWSLGVPFRVLFACPSYLAEATRAYFLKLGADDATCFGTITGAPSVMLVSEPTEAGPQGYDLLLREQQSCDIDRGCLQMAADAAITDALLFPAGFDLEPLVSVLAHAQCKVHADLGNVTRIPDALTCLGRPLRTAMLSTSSPVFVADHKGSVEQLVASLVPVLCERVLFKENRGGSRLLTLSRVDTVAAGAQLRPVLHSVGVGDVFDVAFLTSEDKYGEADAMKYASWVSGDYGTTASDSDFQEACAEVMSMQPSKMPEGVSLPWEGRPSFSIYVAGPDFDGVDTTEIYAVANCLRYHNFKARLPIQENGRLGASSSSADARRVCRADIELLAECDVLVAVHLFDDPGTLVELGYAIGRGIPTIVYAPKKAPQNPILAHLPGLVTDSLDQVVSKVFSMLGRKYNENQGK